MLASSGPEPIAEPGEVLLVDTLQHPHDRFLDKFVLQRRDADRTLPSASFGDVDSLRRPKSMVTGLGRLRGECDREDR